MTREEHIERAEKLLATWGGPTAIAAAHAHATLALAMTPKREDPAAAHRSWWSRVMSR